MTDADRLRQAAEKVLWDSTFLQESDFPELQNQRRQMERLAALLRAVADWHKHVTLPGESQGICVPCQMVWPCTQAGAALALADVILGGAE